MSVFSCFRDGMKRVNGAPAILAAVWLMTVVVALPLALVLRGMIAQQLGNSLTADSVANGVSYDWMQEFAAQASGIGVTFTPTIVGFGATLDNLSAFIDDEHRPIVIAGAAGAYIVLWLFVAGGIIDRYARRRAVHAAGFFAICGVFFLRFLRLAVVMFVVYAVLFGAVHPWLFDRIYPRLTHDLTVERTAFLVRVALYAVFGALVAACSLVFDYAKVRAVVEDRRSMLGAIVAALRFAVRYPRETVALYALDFLAFVLAVVLYAVVAPGASGAAARAWLAFAIGQAYILVRLWVKLVFWASETALFQSRLAHAGYVAAPMPTWPESATVEAIRRA